MKKINWSFLFIAIALASFTFLNSSCEKEESKEHEEIEMHEDHDEGHHDHEENEEMEGHEDSEYNVNDEEAQMVVSKYLLIKEALVNTDPAGAAEAANELIKEAEALEAGPEMDSLLIHVQTIASTSDVEKQREVFAHLSEHIFEMAEGHDLGMTLYKDYCPMALDNEGAYWLSEKEEILNPYFGDKMLHCGSVKEVISEK